MSLFPFLSVPAQKAAVMPEAKLWYESEPKKKPMVPPRNAESVPMYGPSSIPKIGAMMAAAVIACPGRPIIGEIFMKPKTA